VRTAGVEQLRPIIELGQPEETSCGIRALIGMAGSEPSAGYDLNIKLLAKTVDAKITALGTILIVATLEVRNGKVARVSPPPSDVYFVVEGAPGIAEPLRRCRYSALSGQRWQPESHDIKEKPH
jgi:hypothetical protein